MTGEIKDVFDMNGVRYPIGRELGRGGQGKVYETEGGRLAVKLIFDRSIKRQLLCPVRVNYFGRFFLPEKTFFQKNKSLNPAVNFITQGRSNFTSL